MEIVSNIFNEANEIKHNPAANSLMTFLYPVFLILVLRASIETGIFCRRH